MKQKFDLEKYPIESIKGRLFGGAGIGVVILCFMFFIFILLPLILNICEMKNAHETLERARLAAELSASEMILEFETIWLSEQQFEWSTELEKRYHTQITEKFKSLNIKGEIEMLRITPSPIGAEPCINISFKWLYVPSFVQHEFYKRYIEVNYVYEFPIL